MRYLIDGYNLFFKLKEEILPLEKKRNEFIELLDQEVGDLGLNALLIFDAHVENNHDYAPKRKFNHLEISFSPSTLSADDYILELLEWNSKNTTLITSDKSLGDRAKHLGAKVKTVEAFTQLISKKRKKKAIPRKREIQETDRYIKHYLEAFEKTDPSLEEDI